MYVNVLFGLVFLALVMFLMRRFASGRFQPRSVMREELDKRLREAEKKIVSGFGIMAHDEMRPLVAAVREMVAELPNPALVTLQDDGDRLHIMLPRGTVEVAYCFRTLEVGADRVARAPCGGGRWVVRQPGVAEEQFDELATVGRHLARVLASGIV